MPRIERRLTGRQSLAQQLRARFPRSRIATILPAKGSVEWMPRARPKASNGSEGFCNCSNGLQKGSTHALSKGSCFARHHFGFGIVRTRTKSGRGRWGWPRVRLCWSRSGVWVWLLWLLPIRLRALRLLRPGLVRRRSLHRSWPVVPWILRS